MSAPGRVWIQGAGEMASAAAVSLVAAGYAVVMAEIANPLAVRRLVCFSEAVYEGKAMVVGWPGHLVPALTAEFLPGQVVVIVDPEASQLARLAPDAVVDARMTKTVPKPLAGLAVPLIGLGPGFTCGQDATLVVETMRGPDLGRVISRGQAEPYSGRPGPVDGRTLARILRAPAAGHLAPVFQIGDLVGEGQIVGHVGGVPVVSALTGLVRGLVHPGAELFAGEKVGDVDPRGNAVNPAEMTDKARQVGEGVRQALLRLSRKT